MKSEPKYGFENSVADHISRILVEHQNYLVHSRDPFLEEWLFEVSEGNPSWFAHTVDYIAVVRFVIHWPKQDKDDSIDNANCTFERS